MRKVLLKFHEQKRRAQNVSVGGGVENSRVGTDGSYSGDGVGSSQGVDGVNVNVMDPSAPEEFSSLGNGDIIFWSDLSC